MSCLTVWNLMLARTYISNSIPRELFEAASIDGASHIYYFFHVVLPLCGTITAVLCIYYGVNYWNDWYNALIYLRNKNFYPMPFVLREILAKLQIDTPMYSDIFSIEDLRTLQEKKRIAEVVKYCAIIMSTGPAVMLYLFMQKFFVKGVMIGSLKG
jgi:putative aldouronate transport system permease protein